MTTTLNGGESEIFMLEIKTTEEFRYEEIIGEEKRFVLDDVEGYIYMKRIGTNQWSTNSCDLPGTEPTYCGTMDTI